MNGKELFNQLAVTLERVMPSQKCYDFFEEIRRDVINTEILDSFYQLKKDDKGSGLALEVLFFDQRILYDIVFSSNSMVLSLVPLSKINSVVLRAVHDLKKQDDNSISTIDELTLTIFTKDYQSLVLEYKSDTKKFTEFNRVRNNIIKVM